MSRGNKHKNQTANRQGAPESQHSDAPKPWWQSPTFWTAAATIVIAFFTIILAVASIYQGVKIASADKTAREALVDVQRAFVTFDGFKFYSMNQNAAAKCCVYNLPAPNPEKVLMVSFAFRNSGNTPTRNLRILVQCPTVGPPTQPSEPFSLLQWTEAQASPQVIGPQQSIEIGPCNLSPEDLLNTQMGIVHRYLLAEARYSDIFDPNISHLTEVSRELLVSSFKPDLSESSLETLGVGRHNCADDECPQ